jgi:hypothetical protein
MRRGLLQSLTEADDRGRFAAMTKTVAPWTDEQVLALNRFQTMPVHAFTCVNPAPSGEHVNLVAKRDGWICPDCDYTQDWAHEEMIHIGKMQLWWDEHPETFERVQDATLNGTQDDLFAVFAAGAPERAFARIKRLEERLNAEDIYILRPDGTEEGTLPDSEAWALIEPQIERWLDDGGVDKLRDADRKLAAGGGVLYEVRDGELVRIEGPTRDD